MKTKLTELLLLIAVSVITCGCNNRKSSVDQQPDVKTQITITGNLTDFTKVTNTVYENGDKLGLYVVNQSPEGVNGTLVKKDNHIDNMAFTLTNSSWIPTEPIYWKDNNTKAELYCYYPYAEVSNVLSHEFQVETNQSLDANYRKSDFTWGKTDALTPTLNSIAIQTKHIFSNVLIYIAAGSGLTPDDIANAQKSVVFYAKTKSSVNLSTGEGSSVGTAEAISPKVEGDYFSMIIPSQTISESDGVLIEITLNGRKYQLSKSCTFVAGKQHTLTATLDNYGFGNITIGLSDWATGEEIRLDKTHKSLPNEGGDIDVNVTASSGYAVEIPSQYQSWISEVMQTKVSTKTLKFTIQPNAGSSYREGEILFRSSVDGTIIERIKVMQSSPTEAKFHVEVPGTLGYLIGENQIAELKSLTVSGNLSADDFFFIRDLMGQVESINLYETTVSSIPDFAFCTNDVSQVGIAIGMSKLKTITFPKQLRTIGVSAFRLAGFEEVVIPQGVKSIGLAAFSRNPNLRKVSIPKSVTNMHHSSELPKSDTIGGAFGKCPRLTEVVLEDGLAAISNYTFSRCAALTKITISSSVKSIGYKSFAHCSSLTSINIPSSVTSFGGSAFVDCSSLTSVVCNAVNPPAFNKNAPVPYNYPPFNGTPDSKILKVPAASVSAYKADADWSSAFNNGNNIQPL